MGKLFETFRNLKYMNEDDVTHKFVSPLLRDFLGYKIKNLLFKRRYLAREGVKLKNLSLNRTVKVKLKNLQAEPDIIVADDIEWKKIFYKNNDDKALFLVEVKGPGEKLERHTQQKNAYHIAVQANLSVLTNGSKFYIYDFNELILKCENIKELDLKFSLVCLLLHKKYQFNSLLSKLSNYERNLKLPLPQNIDYSDFWSYIKEHLEIEENLNTLGEIVKKIQNYSIFKFTLENDQDLGYTKLLERVKISTNVQDSPEKDTEKQIKKAISTESFIIQGDSGVGKSVLLRHLQQILMNQLYNQKFKKIPILLELKFWSIHSNLIEFILNEVNIDFLEDNDIKRHLLDGNIILFLDGYDELDYSNYINFHKDLLFFKRKYPLISFIITTRKEIIPWDLKDEFSDVITLEPPEIEDLEKHIQINLNYDPKIFLQHLQDKNLIEFIRIPLLLNYLIIYFRKFSNFPNSLYEILSELTRSYFQDHIRKKLVIRNRELLDFPNKILSKIAFKMIYENHSFNLNRVEFNKILSDITDVLRENYEIDENITDRIIVNFLIKINFIVYEEDQYSFWHPLLLKYFSSLEFAFKINTKELLYKPVELFHNFIMKDLIVLSYPIIENKEYTIELKNSNIFLYIESILQNPKLDIKDLENIKKILLNKLNSKYSIIRKLSMDLLNKFILNIDKKIPFFIEIIENFSDPEIIKWALNSIGKSGKKEGYAYLMCIVDKFENRRDYFHKPLRGFVLLALSSFDEDIVQKILIDEIEREWAGVDYLKMIGDALENISKRGKLSQESFQRILKIYKDPKDFGLKISERHYIRKDALEKVMISIGKQEDITEPLFEIMMEEFENAFSFDIGFLIGKILRKKSVPYIIQQIKNHKNNIKYRESFANILRFSDVSLNFTLLMDLFYKLKDFGLNSELFDLYILKNDFKTFKEKFPAFKLSYLFHLILECLLNENRIRNFDVSKLLDFLRSYLNYPHQGVLESVYKIFAKYDLDTLLNQDKVWLDRSVIEYLKPCISHDIKRGKEIIQKYFDLYFEEPETYHDHLLMGEMLELLLENNEISTAAELFEKYIKNTEKIENILYNLRPLNKFPIEYSTNYLKTLKEKILNSEEPISNLGKLVFNLSRFMTSINHEDYIDFCLEIAELFTKEYDFDINSLFHIITYLKPYDYEEKIIKFLERKISEGYRLVASLNALFFIGTDKSIAFLNKFLDSDNELLRNKSFSCIKYIFENQNKLWYNGEELLKKEGN